MQMRIEGDGIRTLTGTSAILVPHKALAEAGFVRMVSADQTTQGKHEFQALAQTARLRFEDRELTPTAVTGNLRVILDDQTLELDRGLLIVRLTGGEIVLLSNSDQATRKYLEAAHRYCTRWIRLDL